MTRLDKQQPTRSDLLADAVRISRLAGKLLKDRLLTDISVAHKGEVDLVTEMDRSAQDLIEQEILVKYPDHGILAEEDLHIQGSDGFHWIVDPLDGTTNYAHRFPVFSVSIAVAYRNDILCGVVFNPVTEELFTAIRGEGASLNDMPIRVSKINSLNDSLLGTGFPYNIRESSQTNLDHFKEFAMRTQGIRRCGSAALDLCFVACGRLEGFWELNLKSWDIAAGALIVREAGGVTTDFEGTALEIDGSRVLASNGHIHEQMMEILKISV
ncbi:MAG: inositol monophosphatase family protein [bacterium]|nr:inositol monophosphatase family protein [bacterium]MDT8365694.1 inositol monophosphatase family protein [bacterium]